MSKYSKEIKKGLGAKKSPYDPRNYSMRHPKVIQHFIRTGILQLSESPESLPASVDNRPYCSPVLNQGSLGDCTAFASVALLEFSEKLFSGGYVEGSELYMYNKLLTKEGFACNSGTYISDSMYILKNTGNCTEACYPYQQNCPLPGIPAQCDNQAGLYRIGNYVDLSAGESTTLQVLNNIKANVAAKYAVTIGFAVYNLPYHDSPGGEWYYCEGDTIAGGHANLIVGYDDNHQITNSHCSDVYTGALLVKNSWGTGWGYSGFGWIPYDFVLNNRSFDYFISTGLANACIDSFVVA